MENCSAGIIKKEYTAPTISYDEWKKEKLKIVKDQINNAINNINNKPLVVILEIGHFTLPRNDSNLDWAFKNMDFANELCAKLIKKYKKDIKIIPTLLVNNLDSEQDDESAKVIAEMLEGKKYINEKSLKILSERNLKNRAYKALKNNSALVDSFIHIDGKAYLKDEEYQHDLAAGFVDEKGDIIPRCGLILTSFLDKVADLAVHRMHPQKDIDVVFVSFSQEYHEYERVKLGVDIYSKTHDTIKITPIVMHWGYAIDQCHITSRSKDEKKWTDIDS
jgi:hypothetical protein